MAKSLQIQINSSYKRKKKLLEDTAVNAVKEKLEEIARYATNVSPVDTGAYVTSFSYTIGAGRPRGKSSLNKPTGVDAESAKVEGLSNLMRDISQIRELQDIKRIELRNGAPHAEYVENGNGNSRGHFVFTKIRGEFR